MKKGNKRWLHAAALSFGMAVLLVFSSIGTVTAQGITKAQDEKKQLEQELKEAQKMIDGLKNSKEDIEDAVRELDEKLQTISRKISELEDELTAKQQEVEVTGEELAAAQQDRDKQYENMKLRIQFLYENRSTSALEMLLSSRSIAEFLNNAEYIAQISQYDRNMLVKYEDTVENIAKMEENLKTEIAQLQKMKQQVEKEQQTVGAMVQEKEQKLAETRGELTDAQQVADAYEAEIQAQNEIIAQIQAAEAERIRKEQERAAQAAQDAANAGNENAGNENTDVDTGGTDTDSDSSTDTGGTDTDSSGSTDTGSTDTDSGSSTDNGGGGQTQAPTGKFTWPCPSSRRITSDYGPRNSPTAGASSYHKGIDIGAAYGADIVAAADGTVVFAGYSNSAGNYVTVSHGGGLYTVYMHCSSLVAGNGQSVSRGQVIAKVGSTGISTGNHLHFGVTLNGSYVNPWGYL